MHPTLSILIASIPDRFAMATALYSRLQQAAKGLPVEILMFTDNRVRSIGKKREALVKLATGQYVICLDDDEDFFEGYITDILEATQKNPDVITFKQKCTINGKSFIVDFDINNPVNEEAQFDKAGNYIDIKRRPFHVCAWKAEIAKSEDFADAGYGEDWHWCERLLKQVKTQVKIDKVLHHYIYDDKVTAAPTESNEIWTNPQQKMPQKKRCIVNFADKAGWYSRGQQRLKDECFKYFPGGDVVILNDYDLIGSPKHHDNPYAFKVYAIDYARKLGYTSILFVDSSIYPVKDVTPVFDHIEKQGYLMQQAGHFIDRWTNDACRAYFNLSPEESKNMIMYSAGFTGLDFTNMKAVEFFTQWKAAAEAGAFKGSWSDHRHDMTCGSIIAQRLGMEFDSFNWFSYAGGSYGEGASESFFKCQPC